MSKTTKIQWADATWNPWTGYTKVSTGCKNCFAEVSTPARVLRSKGQETWGKGAKRSRTSAAYWRNPILWDKHAGAQAAADTYDGHAIHRPRIFPSLFDWLDDEVPIEWLADFLRIIYETPNLDWLLLTKRPGNFFNRVNSARCSLDGSENGSINKEVWKWIAVWTKVGNPPANVWIGTSVEDQANADKRIPELLRIPAKVRFLSVKPLLGPMDLEAHVDASDNIHCRWCDGFTGDGKHDCYAPRLGIDWVIVGGESGPGARPCNIDWIRSVVAQCKAAVPCFVKQLGAVSLSGDHALEGPYFDHSSGLRKLPLKDKKGGDPSEWPADLRVWEFPV